ncbi:(Na+)-NQR maturation NqrM [uncultured Photobacterium sp.]|uniref:(Na+)-NQR maturation NqrM n=1 Tax=uncultured Photobacterium sp. TaxID=173973 RepID=UPI002624B74A|nr:(Na+)-NQR maturation NqrM [uncultured Photobacterium sp.]
MTLLLTLMIFLLVIVAMAIGWIIKKKTISGSCGGLASVGIDRECDCEETCETHQLYQIQEPQKKR